MIKLMGICLEWKDFTHIRNSNQIVTHSFYFFGVYFGKQQGNCSYVDWMRTLILIFFISIDILLPPPPPSLPLLSNRGSRTASSTHCTIGLDSEIE